MKLSVISFTRKGSGLCERLCRLLREHGHEACGYVPSGYAKEFPGATALSGTAAGWTKTHFAGDEGLLFIGAAGIAVRLIAPCLRDKLTDPAVVVLDDEARHAIALLSGHVGGANRLTEEVAALVGAEPVITTATDLRGKLAVDVWAKRHGLLITDRKLAKRAAQQLADGGRVGVFVDPELETRYGAALSELLSDTASYRPGNTEQVNVCVTVRHREENGTVLSLVPRVLVLGIGCRRGMSAAQIARTVRAAFAQRGLDLRAAAAVASIDLKREEAGLLAFAGELGVPFLVFSAQELSRECGNFHDSEFVRSAAGVGNVCERAAMAAARRQEPAGTPVLLMEKYAQDGVTAAAALMTAQA